MKQRGRHRDKVSVIGGLLLSPRRHHPRLAFRILPKEHFDGVRVAQFLRQLLRQVRGRFIVVWDNGSMHRGEPIRRLLRKFPRLSIEHLPPYAPELNPAEAVWNHLKYQALANFTPHNVEEIEDAVTAVLQKAQADPARLRSFHKATPLANPTSAAN